ncbi:hypothetical protein [Alkalinema sp. FACHB-956]|uniref:hypothetical protein n=1 Tax=Alkalinema sp. FACHB-956 TaxID=2692768 RepID=UPI0016884A7E|nr:hypothetical protein [Alkalinema sp. FACHB-956]MBD2325589.1 hypothetical protein [Alkalinema sp. FACHB-956]
MALKNFLPKVSPALFALILICFFMPFVTISCKGPGQEIPLVKMTGFEVATGKKIASPNLNALGSPDTSANSLPNSGSSKQNSKEPENKVPGNALAGVAFAVACAGVALGFVAVQQQMLIQAAIGGLGAIVLLFLKLGIDGGLAEELKKSGNGNGASLGLENMIGTTYEIGYWLSLLLFIAAAGWNGYLYWQDKQSNAPKPPSL